MWLTQEIHGLIWLMNLNQKLLRFLNGVILQHYLGAVSYTHLDVYKRQHIRMAELWMYCHSRAKMALFGLIVRGVIVKCLNGVIMFFAVHQLGVWFRADFQNLVNSNNDYFEFVFYIKKPPFLGAFFLNVTKLRMKIGSEGSQER